MGELEKIAIGKNHAKGKQIIAGLEAEIKGVVARGAARGMGGGLIHEGKRLIDMALTQQGEAITKHFRWAITESMWSSQAEIDRFIRLSRDDLEPVLAESRVAMTYLTGLLRLERHLPEYLAEIDAMRDRVWTDIDLALRETAATAKRRKVRGAVEAEVNWVSKLFRWAK